ncbi:MAG TPA: SDR family oxidoreductase [Lachnospiraceae bacterium]|nr:SDR family oxidoreductase [Lachnospiraceae bacterium]
MKDKKKRIVLAGGAASAAAAYFLIRNDRQKKADETDGTGKTVLITGASGGIGKEFAFIFAKHHFNLVLVARSMDKLEELKMELENSYDVEVTVISKDLSDEDAAEQIYEEVEEKGITVDQLVNNAGAGKQSRVIDADKDTLNNLIHLNVSSVTMLCRLFGSDMARRGSGRILNVSSMGAFIPDPYFNVYGPTKAYELFLSEAMYGEMKGSGVTVSVLCPGPVKTNWAANAGKADSRFAKSPELVAKEGFHGMQMGELVIVPSADYRFFRGFMKHLPCKIQAGVIAAWQKSLIGKE